MAKHGIRANRKKAEPRATIQAAPSFHDVTHPVGSAERFLDEAAKEALAAAAAGGLPSPKRLAAGAARAAAKEVDRRYPDPILAEAAKLPKDELLARAARAEAFREAMEAQNATVAATSAVMSPVGNLVENQVAATVHDTVRQDAKGGRTVHAAQGAQGDIPPVDEEAPAERPSGPRIVINPTTFKNSKDALCVAFNEGFRLWMEATGFEPQSEPTERQRRFFSDTAYADDEVQLRRTILARIATFDTSVKDPTDDQLSETAGFLNAILESPDWCKNDWERNAVQKLARAVEASVGAEPVEPRPEPVEPRAGEPLEARAALGGGETDEEKYALQNSGRSDLVDSVEEKALTEREAAQAGENPAETQPVEAQPATQPVEAQQAEAQPAAQQAEAQPVETPPAETQQAEAQTAAQPAETQQAEAPGKADPRMARLTRESKNLSDIWTGGEVGKGRRLTKVEAEFIKDRIDRGASVSAAQRAMFEPARTDQVQVAGNQAQPVNNPTADRDEDEHDEEEEEENGWTPAEPHRRKTV